MSAAAPTRTPFAPNESLVRATRRSMATHLGVVEAYRLLEVLVKIKSAPRSDDGMDIGVALVDDVQRRFLVLMPVGTADLEVVPVPRDPVPQVGFEAKGFLDEELIFDQAVNGFDVAPPGVGLRRDVVMIGPEKSDGGRQTSLGTVFEEL